METLHTIAIRKSVRSFTSEPISEDVLQKLIAAGSAAPVGMGAHQTVKITVIQNDALIEQIRSMIEKAADRFNFNPFYTPNVLVVVSCLDDPSSKGRDISNATCVVENMHLAATDLGLGSVILWGCIKVMAELPEIHQLLEIPEDFIPLAGLSVGHTTEAIDKAKPDKKFLEVNVIR